MPYKSPVEHLTPRNVAVETSAAGTFTGADATYDAKAGVPVAFARGVASDNVGATFGAPSTPPQLSPIAALKGKE